jgi:hypothetical protein
MEWMSEYLMKKVLWELGNMKFLSFKACIIPLENKNPSSMQKEENATREGNAAVLLFRFPYLST